MTETLTGKDPYSQLAGLLDYPHEDIQGKIEEAINIVSGHSEYSKEISDSLKEFKREIREMTLDDLQGVYSYTFEMSSDYSLDLGSHILEGFKRSGNLVHIKTMYRRFEFPFESLSKGELPDHLPLVLRFLAFVKDEQVKKDFRMDFVIRAMEKLYKNFQQNQENPYRHVIAAVYKVLDRDVKEVK